MAEREPISKKLRFEIFKRDSFTCQYCGKKAPDVVLEIDHIKPVASGGDNTLLNLVTSCYECNHGKGARELSDDSVITKQRDQLDTLQEKREQIDMMIEWQASLTGLDNYQLDVATKFIDEMLSPRFSINESYKTTLRKLLKKYPFQEVLESIAISRDQYLEYDGDRAVTRESVENFLSKISGILRNRKLFSENPEMKELYYIRGILRNRFGSYVSWREMKLIEEAHRLGANVEEMKAQAATVRNISTWRNEMTSFIDGANNGK